MFAAWRFSTVFFFPRHYGLSVALKFPFRESDIQRQYPNEKVGSFLNIRKMLLKKHHKCRSAWLKTALESCFFQEFPCVGCESKE